ncbi:MAG: OmpA family protein [Bacteroidia bacterium]|nr:OmpA family protein [Bacteroidia bacterium]
MDSIKNSASLFLVFLYVFLKAVHCQNIVPNGDFETHNHFFSFRTLGDLSKWEKANLTTPDYCTSAQNIGGTQSAHSGSAYIGIVLSLDTITKYKYVEYIRVKLLKRLLANKNYCLSMYLSRSDNELFAVASLNYKLSAKKLISKKQVFIMADEYGSLQYSKDTILRDKKNWMAVCSKFSAIGDEIYLTIGYFNPDTKLIKVEKGRAKFYSAYYYIDDVSLIEVTDTNTCDCTYKGKQQVVAAKSDSIRNFDNIEINEPIILNNIYFRVNEWDILPQSEKAITEIFIYLKKHSDYFIEILGHTDNSGNEKTNITLSENRAQAVTKYLILKGIEPTRIQYKGYGSSMPVADNSTEEGRTKNRRVEFKLLKK